MITYKEKSPSTNRLAKRAHCSLAIFPAALNIISPATTSPNRHSPCQVQRVTKYAPDWV
jgi:hypothetical protein